MLRRILRLLGDADAIHAAAADVVARGADAEKDRAVATEGDARGADTARDRIRDEDVADVGEGMTAVVAAAGEHGDAGRPGQFVEVHRLGLAGRELGIGEVDQLIAGEVRVNRDVHQSLVARVEDVRHAGHRPGVEGQVGTNETDAAGPFGDQHVAAGQEGQRPRPFESLERRDADAVSIGLQHLRLIGQGIGAGADPSPHADARGVFGRRGRRRRLLLLRVAHRHHEDEREDDEQGWRVFERDSGGHQGTSQWRDKQRRSTCAIGGSQQDLTDE